MPRWCCCYGSLCGESILCCLRMIFLRSPICFQELMQLRIRDLPVAFRRIFLRGLCSLDDKVEDVFPSLNVAAMDGEVCRGKKCFELRLHVIKRALPDGILDESCRNVIGLRELWRISGLYQNRLLSPLKSRFTA